MSSNEIYWGYHGHFFLPLSPGFDIGLCGFLSNPSNMDLIRFGFGFGFSLVSVSSLLLPICAQGFQYLYRVSPLLFSFLSSRFCWYLVETQDNGKAICREGLMS
jgi:hypothetical protein